MMTGNGRDLIREFLRALSDMEKHDQSLMQLSMENAELKRVNTELEIVLSEYQKQLLHLEKLLYGREYPL